MGNTGQSATTQRRSDRAAVSPPRAKRRSIPLAIGMITAILTFAAFMPTIFNDFLSWDDELNFLDNQNYRGLAWSNIRWMFTSFHAGHYQPISWLTLGWDFVWGGKVFGEHPTWGYGMDPRAYHITNNLLHAVNAMLVYLLALRLLALAFFKDCAARPWPLHIAAAIAALLFSVHPLRVENVAWITERRDLVSSLLLLLTVLAYLRACRFESSRHWKWIGAALALYTLSLMAKVSGVPLVAALLAMDWHPLRRLGGESSTPRRVVWLEKIPFAAIALLFSFIAVKGQAGNLWLYPLEGHPMSARMVQAAYGLVFYIWKSLLPLHLLPLYDLHRPMDISEGQFVASIIVLAASVIGLGWLAIAGKCRGLLVAMICYAVFLGPVLGFFQNGPQIVADRYSYLPSIGLSIWIGGCVWWLIQKGAETHRPAGRIAVAASMIIIIVLGGLTWRQCGVWRNGFTLWSCTLATDPDSALASDSYGVELMKAGRDPSEAIPYFQKAVKNDPHFKVYRKHLRDALREAGRMQEVLAAWVDEAKFGELNADYHFKAGLSALNANDLRIAMEHFSVSILLDPNQPQAHFQLGQTLEKQRRMADAERIYRHAIELDPNGSGTRFALASLLAGEGRKANAIAEVRALLAIAPDHAAGRSLLDQLQR